MSKNTNRFEPKEKIYCPKCGSKMEGQGHKRITEKELRKKYYYTYWERCQKCGYMQHYEKYKHYNGYNDFINEEKTLFSFFE